MPNLFATPPVLAEKFPHYPKLWACPITGIGVPKDPTLNLEWRASMLEQAEEDPDFQQDLYTASSQSIIFWVNAFVFTLRIFEPGEDGKLVQAETKHLPYVTWEIQDKHILAIQDAITNGTELLTDKSRDMGATWDHIVVLVHRLLFRADESHLIMSRKEDAVDQLSLPKNYPFGPLADPGTLFGKIDYVLNRLPEWMLPRMTRKKMHLVNLDNKTHIDGESSNATAGSSDRRTSILLDEMAKMKEAESIKRSTADVTACRLPVSTPNGAGTTYSKWRQSGTIPVFVLPWWEHPEKGANRSVKQTELGKYYISSPWYENEKAKRTPKELAIEIDMDHVGSGDLFFESDIIEQHKSLHGTEARYSVAIGWGKTVSDLSIREAMGRADFRGVVVSKKGRVRPLRIWASLPDGRLDQTKTYTVGCDISKGQGASNSVASIMCDQTGEKIGEWANANTPPHEFAKVVMAICVWVGGRNRRPLLIWENNGDPGYDFGRTVVHVYGYPSVFFDRVAGTVGEKRGKRYGWRSTPEKKATGLGQLRRAYAFGTIINHSVESLDEATQYVSYENGGIGPAELVAESSAARKTHGDRVIADMLCVLGRAEAPKLRPLAAATPQRSFAARLKMFKAEKSPKARRDRFNFTE